MSKLKNSRATRFNPPSNNAKIDHSNDIPGPGVYEVYSGINKDGRFHYSKFENSRVRTFGRGSDRKGLGEDKSDTPGPGSYELETTFVGPDLKG